MYYFLGSEELLVAALIGLILVLRNWWELVECGFEQRKAPVAALPIRIQPSVPGAVFRPRPLAGAVRRQPTRRRRAVKPGRHGHRPVKHHI